MRTGSDFGARGLGGRIGMIVLAAALALAGCSRDEAPLSPCIGADPAVPRVKDAGPPNCATLLPGEPQASPAPPLDGSGPAA